MMTDPDRMRLWTIQTKEAWERAEKTGVLEFNEIADKGVDDWFRPAYDWMVGQLEKRVKNYPRNKYPIGHGITQNPICGGADTCLVIQWGCEWNFLLTLIGYCYQTLKPGMLYSIAGISL